MEQQPRFADVKGCYFRSLLGDENRWHFVDIHPSTENNVEDEERENFEALNHLATMNADSIKEGNIGAIVTDDPASAGYYLVEFTGLPYTDQRTGELLCNCNWLYKVDRCLDWYRISNIGTIARVLNIVNTDVELMPIGPSNMPKTNQKKCKEQGGKKISRDSHLAILDEIFVRDTIEFDPTIDYIVDVDDVSESEREEEDNESLSEEENVEEEE